MKSPLNELTTVADSLYRDITDGEARKDPKDFIESVEVFLDQIVSYLESNGGQVDGMEYSKADK